MAKWHYYNENREKIGPITGTQLKQLVREGAIMPSTFVEDPSGRTGLAKDVRGLTFTETVRPEPSPLNIPPLFTPSAPVVSVPPAATKQTFCTNCGNPVSEQAVACVSCGAKPTGHKKFCHHCGVALNPEQVICVMCGTTVSVFFDAGVKANEIVAVAMTNLKSAFQETKSVFTDSFRTDSNAMNNPHNTYLIVFLICYAVGILLCIGGFVQVRYSEPTAAEVMMTLGGQIKNEQELIPRRLITSPVLMVGIISLIVGVSGFAFCCASVVFKGVAAQPVIPNYLIIWSIILLLCGVWVVGIPGVIFSVLCKKDLKSGNHVAADKKAKIALWCNVAGQALYLICVGLLLIVYLHI